MLFTFRVRFMYVSLNFRDNNSVKYQGVNERAITCKHLRNYVETDDGGFGSFFFEKYEIYASEDKA